MAESLLGNLQEGYYNNEDEQEENVDMSEKVDTEGYQDTEEEYDGYGEDNIEEDEETVSEEIADEGEYEEWEYPDWAPDELVTPEYEDPNDELEWYRNNYHKAFEHYKSPEFAKELLNSYEDALIEKEQNVQELKAIKEMLENNPEQVIRTYAPHYLQARGYNAQMTEDEIYSEVDNQLAAEFGSDYKEIYNPDAANDPKTISGKMLMRQQEIIAELEDRNNQIASYTPPTKEELEERLMNQYSDEEFDKSGYTLDEFTEFKDEAIHFVSNMTLRDVHYALYHDDYVDDAYKRGYADGKKGVVSEIERAGGRRLAPEPVQSSKRSNGTTQEYDKFGNFGKQRSQFDLIIKGEV